MKTHKQTNKTTKPSFSVGSYQGKKSDLELIPYNSLLCVKIFMILQSVQQISAKYQFEVQK